MKFYDMQLNVAMKAAQEIAKAQGLGMDKVMPGELIMVVPLEASKDNYEINLATETGVTNIPIENRLAFRNNFIISAMALGVLKAKISGGVTYWGSSAPVFHEDPNVFAAAAGGGSNVLSESEAIAGVWGGSFTLNNNEQSKIIEFPTRGFRTVHQTQQGGVTDGTDAFITQNMQNGEEYKSLGGLVKLAGGNQNKLNIQIQTIDKTLIVGTATGKNYLYVALRGAYLRGGTISELQG